MSDVTNEFLKIISDLLDVSAPGKQESVMADKLSEYIVKAGHSPELTDDGNLVIRFEGKTPDGPLTILAAHMDEVAMSITDICDNGELKVRRLGGLRTYKLGERMLDILTEDGEKIKCLFSIGSEHGRFNGKASDLEQYSPQWDDVRVITGLTPEQLEAKGVREGLGITPVRDGRGPYVFGDEKSPMVAAWTFDDRAGVALLIQLLMRLKPGFKFENPLIIAFTTQEESGCYGARALAKDERPHTFIAIDGCPIIDKSIHIVDERPGSWFSDAVANYDEGLIEDFKTAADKVGTTLQVMKYKVGGSDASAVFKAGLAKRIGFIGHVRENSHGFEVAKLRVFENALNLIETYVKTKC